LITFPIETFVLDAFISLWNADYVLAGDRQVVFPFASVKDRLDSRRTNLHGISRGEIFRVY